MLLKFFFLLDSRVTTDILLGWSGHFKPSSPPRYGRWVANISPSSLFFLRRWSAEYEEAAPVPHNTMDTIVMVFRGKQGYMTSEQGPGD